MFPFCRGQPTRRAYGTHHNTWIAHGTTWLCNQVPPPLLLRQLSDNGDVEHQWWHAAVTKTGMQSMNQTVWFTIMFSAQIINECGCFRALRGPCCRGCRWPCSRQSVPKSVCRGDIGGRAALSKTHIKVSKGPIGRITPPPPTMGQYVSCCSTVAAMYG